MDAVRQLVAVYMVLVLLLAALTALYFLGDFEEPAEKPRTLNYYLASEGPRTVVMGESPLSAYDPFTRRQEVHAIEAEEEELERCLEKLSRRWERDIGGEFYEGYDEQLDHQWIQDLRYRMMLGEDIC